MESIYYGSITTLAKRVKLPTIQPTPISRFANRKNSQNVATNHKFQKFHYLTQKTNFFCRCFD